MTVHPIRPGCLYCGEPVNPATWPGDIGFCTAIHHAFAQIEAQPHPDLLMREREAFAARLRSIEFLASGLGLVLGEKP